MLEEQRCCDGAGEPSVRRIVEIGDVRFEHVFVTGVERQTPKRVVAGKSRRDDRCGELVIIGEGRRQIGTERDARCTGQRGEIDDQGRFAFARLVRASASTSRPSASVLAISTVNP